MPGWRIERVDPQRTLALRQQVLRPHQGPTKVGFPEEGEPETGHFAAVDDAGEVIGTAVVVHQSSVTVPNADPDRSWRLRAMATAAGHRGQGVGSALVAAAQDYVAAHDGAVLWCHARMGAVAFYCKLGFAATGDVWEEPHLGPHVVMWRTVADRPL